MYESGEEIPLPRCLRKSQLKLTQKHFYKTDVEWILNSKKSEKVDSKSVLANPTFISKTQNANCID